MGWKMLGERGRATPRQIIAFASAPPKKPASKIAIDTRIEMDIEAKYKSTRPVEREILMTVIAADTGRETAQSLFETSRVLRSLHDPNARNTTQIAMENKSS
jgi:hypothetical protein